ncbi:MAG TPA: GNAT family N-acetyltransferase [Alphaproteobacteria bacterium]|nr:GNAT family N-acetyltransferase [Alphaproteobacteria bacterium]
MNQATQAQATQHDSEVERDYSSPAGDAIDALARDRMIVRSLQADDLPALIAIDRAVTREDRSEYLAHQVTEAMEQSGIRVSLVAEGENGQPVGFMMARVDFGEFGRTEPEAVMDTLGVDPLYSHAGVGSALMSQLLSNLRSLRVDKVRTGVRWNDFAILHFLESCGFRPSQRLALRKRIA